MTIMKDTATSKPGIRREEFKPIGPRSKVLRCFVDEQSKDYHLSVGPQRPDGTFTLRRIAMEKPGGAGGESSGTSPDQFGDILDPSIVEKIEKVRPGSALKHCDFVIFENSPQAEAHYRGTVS